MTTTSIRPALRLALATQQAGMTARELAALVGIEWGEVLQVLESMLLTDEVSRRQVGRDMVWALAKTPLRLAPSRPPREAKPLATPKRAPAAAAAAVPEPAPEVPPAVRPPAVAQLPGPLPGQLHLRVGGEMVCLGFYDLVQLEPFISRLVRGDA
ncbi:hypothetical protein ACPRNU_12660 [Chromobacterium vaccinii]|uniref:hypothetical protein n=1 Tax=Chromobacterium vaccinii TaxID=1108595 RepID=UPI003C75DDCA